MIATTLKRLVRVATPCVAVALLAVPARACDDTAVAASAARLSDATTPARTVELLELAFDAASALPPVPHAKDRARAQGSVVDACLALDQPDLALRFAEGIEGWRRGLALADVAAWSVRHGRPDGVEARLAAALAAADADPETRLQAWRRDRVRAHVLVTRLLLGEDVSAEAATLADSEAGPLWIARAERVEAADVAGFSAELDAALRAGTLDRVRAALAACVRLAARFPDDAGLRARLDAAFEAAAPKLPRGMAVDLAFGRARAALDRDDPAAARAATDAARDIVQGASWSAEDHVPLLARLGALRALCGDRERGRLQIEAARVIYDDERDRIVDVFRAGALRPLAEAWHAIGDDDAAREVWTLALDEAFGNPNARPRTEDLVALCLSIATSGVDPGDALTGRLRAARAALGDPW